MTADPTLATLRERHRMIRLVGLVDDETYCEADSQPWPCDFEQARQALDAALAERDTAIIERDLAVEAAATVTDALDKAASFLLTSETMGSMSLARGLRARVAPGTEKP